MKAETADDHHGDTPPTVDGGRDSAPLVSVICLTYNHARYIDKCIAGILMQKTDFPVEIIIHDDASNDGTSEIVRNYADRHEGTIVPVLQSENQYSRGNNPKALALANCRGDYIAYCEGDDYWTDPQKLQKQIDYLEQNPGCVVSGHLTLKLDENGKSLGFFSPGKRKRRDFSARELLLDRGFVSPASRVYRNVPGVEPPEKAKVVNGDRFLVVLLGQYGGSKFHDDIAPSHAHTHPGGVWAPRPRPSRRRHDVLARYWLFRYFWRVKKYGVSLFYLYRTVYLALKGNVRLFDGMPFFRSRR